MGVFSRFMDIVNANINALLDKAEDPEKTIKLMMQEMEDTLIELKSACAAKMAKRAKLNRLIEEQKELINRWQARAELAIKKGLEDLAREALVEKKAASAELVKLEEELGRYEDGIKISKADIYKIEEKLASVKLKYQSLLEKARQAKEQERANKSYKNANESETLRRFREMEERVDRMRAENDLNFASKTTEDKFKNLEQSEEIEKELEALKKKSL